MPKMKEGAHPNTATVNFAKVHASDHYWPGPRNRASHPSSSNKANSLALRRGSISWGGFCKRACVWASACAPFRCTNACNVESSTGQPHLAATAYFRPLAGHGKIVQVVKWVEPSSLKAYSQNMPIPLTDPAAFDPSKADYSLNKPAPSWLPHVPGRTCR